MQRLNNRRVCDLGKVQFAEFYYRNQYGDVSQTILPHSYRGCVYDPDENAANWNSSQPVETMEHRAVRLHLKDVWKPELRLMFSSSHPIVYTGGKAKSIWKEYCQRIFNKKK